MVDLILKVLTPSGLVVEESVDEVRVPGVEGEFGVLPDHSSLISSLAIGQLSFIKGVTSKAMAIHSGVIQIENNTVTVFADNAEFAESVDKPRAQNARARAEAKIKQLESELLVDTEDYSEARFALQRAIVRLEVESLGKK